MCAEAAAPRMTRGEVIQPAVVVLTLPVDARFSEVCILMMRFAK